MKAGVIALVDSENRLSDVHQTIPLEENHPVDELDVCINVSNEFGLDNGQTVQVGRAAMEDVTEHEETRITDDGNIQIIGETNTITRFTEFLFVPGAFLAVKSSAGEFFIDLINRHTENSATKARIELNELLVANDDSLAWKVGFEDRAGMAENGVVYGADVLNDAELGEIVGAASKNQVGIDHAYSGDEIRSTTTRSGYVEVYQPSDYNSKEFAEYVIDEILPYTKPR